MSPKSTRSKKRQTRCNSLSQVIAKYQLDVSSVWVDQPVVCNPWFKPQGLTLHCKYIDAGNLPMGFVSTGIGKYQYNFTNPEAPTGTKRYRPVAYRIPFLKNPDFRASDMTVSHLCHNSWCYNWKHHVLEPLGANKARNGCAAGSRCLHKTKCLIPGKFSDS